MECGGCKICCNFVVVKLTECLLPRKKTRIMNQSVPRFTLPFLVLTVLFCVCLIVSNLIEIKTVDIGFATITAGMVVFPLSYIINDCIVEVYGFARRAPSSGLDLP